MFPIIFFSLGLCFLGWAGWRWHFYRSKLLDYHQTQGKVIAWRYGSVIRKTPFGSETLEGQFPCVEYSPKNNIICTLLVNISAKVGDNVTVWYDPDHPQTAQVASRFGMSLPIYASMSIGLILIIIAIFARIQ